MNSEVWKNFEQSSYAKKVMGLEKKASADTPVTPSDGRKIEAQSDDQGNQYGIDVPQIGNVGPQENVNWQDQHQSTQATGGGGGAPDGDSREGYNVQSSPVDGDGKVENIAEKAKVMEEVARKQPTGQPDGNEPGNQPLNWTKQASASKKRILNSLVKLAEEWEADGDKEEFVQEIDAIIDSEVQASKKKSTK